MSERPTLLLVDDDEGYNHVLSRSLTRRGFAVHSARCPATALAEAEAHDPEYVILDLNLAGHSGLNLIRPLLERCPEARILVLTGYASIPTAVSAIKLGARQYLSKPAEVAAIVRALSDEGCDEGEEALLDGERMSVQRLEWEYIQRVLAEQDGNITATAQALRMHRRTLQRKLAKRPRGD